MYQKFHWGAQVFDREYCDLWCWTQLTDQEELRQLHRHCPKHAECHSSYWAGQFQHCAQDWLGSREEVAGIEVCWELWEDDFFQWLLTPKKIGDGPVVFQTVRVKRWLFQKWFYNGLFKNSWKDTSLQRLIDDGCHCWKQLLQAFNNEGHEKWVYWTCFLGGLQNCVFDALHWHRLKKSARKIGCMGHLLAGLAQAFYCLVHRGLFWLSGWNSQQMRQEGHK